MTSRWLVTIKYHYVNTNLSCVLLVFANHNHLNITTNDRRVKLSVICRLQSNTTLYIGDTSPSPLQWCHNARDDVWNHQPHDCLLNRLFRRKSKKTSKIRVTGLCAGNSPVIGGFPAQRASNAENVPFDDIIMDQIWLVFYPFQWLRIGRQETLLLTRIS